MKDIDFENLPSIPFGAEQVELLPTVSAVYFALGRNGGVLYIGKAHNLRHRWKNHHRIEDLAALRCDRICWQELPIPDLAQFESDCIKQFEPVLNGRIISKPDNPAPRPERLYVTLPIPLYLEMKEWADSLGLPISTWAAYLLIEKIREYKIEKSCYLKNDETLKLIEGFINEADKSGRDGETKAWAELYGHLGLQKALKKHRN